MMYYSYFGALPGFSACVIQRIQPISLFFAFRFRIAFKFSTLVDTIPVNLQFKFLILTVLLP